MDNPRVLPLLKAAMAGGRGRPASEGGPRLLSGPVTQHLPGGTPGGQMWHRDGDYLRCTYVLSDVGPDGGGVSSTACPPSPLQAPDLAPGTLVDHLHPRLAPRRLWGRVRRHSQLARLHELPEAGRWTECAAVRPQPEPAVRDPGRAGARCPRGGLHGELDDDVAHAAAEPRAGGPRHILAGGLRCVPVILDSLVPVGCRVCRRSTAARSSPSRRGERSAACPPSTSSGCGGLGGRRSGSCWTTR